jgi:hypothetical protein
VSSSESHTKLNELESAATTPTWRFTKQLCEASSSRSWRKIWHPSTYIYSLAILSSQIDVCAAALTQAQTHKKRETEKATKQWPPMVLLDCTKCAHSRQNVQRDSGQKHTIFSLSLSLSQKFIRRAMAIE